MEIHPLSAGAGRKKRPRSNPPNSSSSGNTNAYQSQKSSGETKKRGPGRPRKNAVKQERVESSSEEDEGDNTSFYLKNQNVSLASELYAYRRRIYLLEREREYRRKECRVAGYKIGELGGVWKGLECAVGKELESNNLLKQVCSIYSLSLFLSLKSLSLLNLILFIFLLISLAHTHVYSCL